MSDNTKIEWADATVNAINGCSVTSPGCTHCYAMKLAGTRMRDHPTRSGLTTQTKAGPVWNGEVRLHEPALLDPLKWAKPRRIFWNAHGDTFHDAVPDEWIDRVLAVCALTPQHTHMILTKRSKRMREYMTELTAARLMAAACDLEAPAQPLRWPLPNLWLGVSVEDQTRADERIPDLLATPAAIRFISAEPLLGPVQLTNIDCNGHPVRGMYWVNALTGEHDDMCRPCAPVAKLDWVIAGGESGPDARPMHPDWARSLRDQCAAANVPFHFKQWGEFTFCEAVANASGGVDFMPPPDLKSNMMRWLKWENGQPRQPHKRESVAEWFTPAVYSIPVGKKAAGRLLDGIEHNSVPGEVA